MSIIVPAKEQKMSSPARIASLNYFVNDDLRRGDGGHSDPPSTKKHHFSLLELQDCKTVPPDRPWGA
ncbi:hypothetical protein [Rhizobium mayense]|uniref:Uncharacterized protein n=1 Tax=Rhizobium mayense TaxID=1312184 RepID=A0ABT7K618_9HYPH|nr:hypothetical protein [Rhizobium mayense]MDL2403430.1 hypothetical protein [Rhizobium mayense]